MSPEETEEVTVMIWTVRSSDEQFLENLSEAATSTGDERRRLIRETGSSDFRFDPSAIDPNVWKLILAVAAPASKALIDWIREKLPKSTPKGNKPVCEVEVGTVKVRIYSHSDLNLLTAAIQQLTSKSAS